MNGESEFSVLHHLHRWRSPDGVRSRLNNQIVAFEGEVRSEHGLPFLFCFDEDDDKLLQLQLLPSGLANHAADFYRDGQQDNEFHRGQVPPRQDYRGNTTATGGRLIPIPVSWAPFFLDYPNMGLTFRCLIHLMWGAEPRDRGHLKPFSNGIALACGTPHPTDDSPCSALDSLWKRVPYTRTTLAGATAAWENHRGTPTAPRKDPPELGEFDSMFGEREEEGDGGWGDSWGYVLPNTPPPPPVAGQRTGPDTRTTESRTESTYLRSVLVAVLDAQSRAQIAVADNHHANLLAFHSLTAQALAARGSDKDSKLTPAKKAHLANLCGDRRRRVVRGGAGLSRSGCQRGDSGGSRKDPPQAPHAGSEQPPSDQYLHYPSAHCDGQLLIEWRQDACGMHKGHHRLCDAVAHHGSDE